MTKDPVAGVAALDAEIEQQQREDKIAREGIASVEVPEGVEVLMDRGDLDARITYLREHSRGQVSDELRRLVSEQAGRDLDAIGVLRAGLSPARERCVRCQRLPREHGDLCEPCWEIGRDEPEEDRAALGIAAQEEATAREIESWCAEGDN